MSHETISFFAAISIIAYSFINTRENVRKMSEMDTWYYKGLDCEIARVCITEKPGDIKSILQEVRGNESITEKEKRVACLKIGKSLSSYYAYRHWFARAYGARTPKSINEFFDEVDSVWFFPMDNIRNKYFNEIDLLGIKEQMDEYIKKEDRGDTTYQ